MRAISRSATTRLALALWATASLHAATSVLRVNNTTKYKFIVTYVPQNQGGNKDNAVVTLYEGEYRERDKKGNAKDVTPSGVVDVNRKLVPGTESDPLPGGWSTWSFSGFAAYCEPTMKIEVLSGPLPVPMIQFHAEGRIGKSSITIAKPKYAGPDMEDGASKWFKIESGELKISEPPRKKKE